MFIDDLAFELLTMSLAALMILYMTLGIYVGYRRNGDKDIEGHLKPGMAPLTLLGVVMLALGLYGEFVWPLPGAFNILYYDMYTLVAIVVLAFAITIRLGYKMQYVGLFAAYSGVMAIYYGFRAYQLSLIGSTTLELFLMFVAFGATGIMSYPVTLIIDRIPQRGNPKWIGWTIILVIFWIAVLGAMIASGYIGFDAVFSHLASPP
ncbi:DUF981 family protein [Cuniculiplasma divulgatum]|uniref:Multipass membrane protein n=1 Tax=Cuniculiplasma divulgatum TaxID=1673428 RepID=A0A1N5WNT5_9ARCH|nr:DUF981 family protein [Cuniculiplasma divulgatum]MCL4319884.1 DUF981 family protein [Candidatus Thermoplasmatota archaeon]WMT50037.1 MAG: DUF981 family protein [Thermoplasmatales archaeon]SIM86836.1 multipass membrane protein [Cuniculiplasma divulgatum]